MALALAGFAVLWVGGVASHWLGRSRDDDGVLASVFLLTAGLIVLLGEPTRRGMALLLSAALFGFAVEVVGERFGVPFGSYTYTGALRPQMLGVPVVMGPAWMVLTAFSCEAVSRLGLRPWTAVALANSLNFVALLGLGLCLAGCVRAKIFNLTSRGLRTITGALFYRGPSSSP